MQGSCCNSGDATAAAVLAMPTALADAGYEAEPTHRLCREALGLRQMVITLNHRGFQQSNRR
jgi:hypothetical protein